MHILILNWRSPWDPKSGGAERVTLKHAEYWVEMGHKVTWVHAHSQFKISNLKFKISFVSLGNSLTVYLLAPFWYLFNKQTFDVVVDEIHGIPFLTPLWAYRSKKIAYIHEVAQEIWDDMVPFPLNIIGKLYEKIYFFFYRKTQFITGSNSAKQDLVQFGIASEHVAVIPHAIDMTPVLCVPKKEKNLTIIFVGRLVKMKGIEDALKICNLKDATLWVIGDGEERYKQMLKTQENIVYFGKLSEGEKLEKMGRAHVLLHPSTREGFGLTVLEANSQGTPVVGYDVAGLRDVIMQGVNGVLVPKGNIQKAADAIVALYSSKKYKKMCETSIQESKKYTWQKPLAAFYKIIST